MIPRLSVFVFGLALAALPGFSVAQDCLEPMGRFPYGVTLAVVAQGGTAFVGNGAAIMIIDLSTPGSPSELASLALPDVIRTLAVDDDRLYAGTGQGFFVIDVSEPSTPVVLGESARFWHPDKMSASGNVVCAHDSQVVVFDVSDATTPVEASTFGGTTADVELVGHHAFFGGVGGLQVLDLSNPYSPVPVGFLPGEFGFLLDADGDLLHAVSSGGGYSIIDISNPTDPTPVGSLNLPGTALDIAVHGDLAFVNQDASWGEGLKIIDVSNPAVPSAVGTVPINPNPNESWVDIAAIDNHALVATWDHGLRVIDATDPVNPAEVAVVDSVAIGEAVAISNDVVFIAALDRGLRVVDVSDPASPEDLTIFDLGGQVRNVAAKGDLVFIASPHFAVIDATDPVQPQIIADDPAIWGDGIEVVDDRVFIATWFGLRVLDVSVPNSPVEIGSIDLGDENWHSVDVLGTLAAIRSASTIAIVDISDLANPTLRSSLDPGWSYTRPVLSGSHLLFASGSSLYTYDLSDPDHPVEVNAVQVSWYGISGLGISGSVAYVATHAPSSPEATIEVLDVGDPANPTFVASRAGFGFVNGFVFSREHLFSTRYDTGFDIYTLCQGPVFGDGFESGDTTAWSSAVP